MTHLTVLVPAHNEAGSIEDTLHALTLQERPADRVVVVPNGCTDDTAALARRHDVVVMELPRLAHRKSEALNRAWLAHCRDTDVVVCLDADTILPPNALGDWVAEMEADPDLGGSSSKFTMRGTDLLTALQRAEFARWTDSSLRRGWTSVLAGTGCAIRNEALRSVVETTGRPGPWSYDSQVEDFELTLQIRSRGWRCHVSPTVRAYTDSMTSVRALWGQRMKWQVGTVEDLLSAGLTPLTALDWRQQALGLFSALVRVAWVVLTVALAVTHSLVFVWFWWVVPPLLFIAVDVRASLVIPHRSRRDVLVAALLVPQEVFAWMRAAWFTAAWVEVLFSRVTGGRKDRWEMQYTAEAAGGR